MRTISFLHRSATGCTATVLVIAAALTSCGYKETVQTLVGSAPSPLPMASDQPIGQPIVQPIPTAFSFGQLFDSNLDLQAGPVSIPLELEIPALKVNAPILGVGLTTDNVMDAPKGPIGDPLWESAYWYRGGGIPGDVGTATLAAHVNDPLGQPEIFANLEDLQPGDLIIIHLKYTNMNISFVVDQVKVYSVAESSDPAVLAQIYGIGPVTGSGPQPSADGLSHLTLITCAGVIVNGEFDHHTVVYATRSK